MADIHLMLPKTQRPTWSPAMEHLDINADPMIEIPLLGRVTAGLPIDLCDENERVSVPSNMVRRNTYALRVQGHSMIDDNIQDGDIIVVERRETAENGQTVVAMINGEQVTLKKFYVERGGIRLQPANQEMQPIILRNEEIQILGIVTGVIRPMD